MESSHNIESMIDIYVDGFESKQDDVIYLRVTNENDNILSLNLMNADRNYNMFANLDSIYKANYKGLNIVIIKNELIPIKKSVPTKLEFTLYRNENYNPKIEASIVDYPELDISYNKISKNIDNIYYDGADVEINKIDKFPYFKLERKEYW
ncbi:hypothetical protein [Avrilella dinanensis]|uniref:hypothetical protein n=1 Tax=Avrilella dinanensis TaxID=2008672 RepID=UPI00240A97B9|nr:hypothetical protein [Avrilella dinanensis]